MNLPWKMDENGAKTMEHGDLKHQTCGFEASKIAIYFGKRWDLMYELAIKKGACNHDYPIIISHFNHH